MRSTTIKHFMCTHIQGQLTCQEALSHPGYETPMHFVRLGVVGWMNPGKITHSPIWSGLVGLGPELKFRNQLRLIHYDELRLRTKMGMETTIKF